MLIDCLSSKSPPAILHRHIFEIDFFKVVWHRLLVKEESDGIPHTAFECFLFNLCCN